MADLIGKIIDHYFDQVKKSQEKKAFKALDADPKYQKAKAKMEVASNDAEQYLEDLKKKYPDLYKKREKEDECCQTEIKKEQTKSSNNNISCLLWLVVIFVIGIFLIFF